MKLFKNIFLGLFAVAFLAAGCAQQTDDSSQEMNQQNMQEATQFTKAVAHIHAKDDGEALGSVTFEQTDNGVNVNAQLSGLEQGKHGFHIHQYGDCTAADLTSAGGHYNPYDMQHGAPTDSLRHMGDMGNLPVGEDGNGTLDYLDTVIELNGPNSIIGRAIIIHSGADDLSSQPSGAAGERVACGVIGIANTGE
ncbi:MAG: superoxide dismutase family protein [Balneolaceae bacterium]|nr:superoxide dismutase family protein [Balneolaceae bacterium]